MLVKTIAPYRKRFLPPKSKKRAAVVPLTLVSANYSAEDLQLTLAFDRAIDLADVVGAAIVLNDAAISGLLLDCTGGTTLIDPVTVRFDLNPIGGATGLLTVLDATAANGIVATDDGAAWAGATNLEIPFP